MSCSADYYLVTCSQRRQVCADVCSAQTTGRYQNIKFTVPSQFGLVGAVNWQRRLVCAEYTSAQTITTVTQSQRQIVGAANVGSTDWAVLHDVIRHDKLFQHRLVGATRTSAPTSRCYQFLQKNIFAHFLQFGCGNTKEQSVLHEIRSTFYYLQQILFFFALLAEQ